MQCSQPLRSSQRQCFMTVRSVIFTRAAVAARVGLVYPPRADHPRTRATALRLALASDRMGAAAIAAMTSASQARRGTGDTPDSGSASLAEWLAVSMASALVMRGQRNLAEGLS